MADYVAPCSIVCSLSAGAPADTGTPPARRPLTSVRGLFIWAGFRPEGGQARGDRRQASAKETQTMADDRFHVYDTTLRDGAQQEGLSLTVADKLAVARH